MQGNPEAFSRPRNGLLTWLLKNLLNLVTRPSHLVFLLLTVLLGFLSLYPTFFLFYGSLTDAPIGVPANLSLKNYVQAFSQRETYKLILNSILVAFGASTFSIVVALTLAWITVRTNAPYKGLLELTAIIPNVVPSLLISMAWVFLLNPSNGIVNMVLETWIGIKPFNIYSLWGLVWVEGMVTAPLAFLIIAAALRSMDPVLEEAARTVGSSEANITWNITLPLMRPAIFAAWSLNFIRALESFDTPAIIALPAGIEVFTTKIFREALDSYPTNHNLAAAYSVSLLMITLLFVYFYRISTSRVDRYTTVTGKGFRPQVIELGDWRYPASLIALIVLLAMAVLPVLTLGLISLLPYYHTPALADLGSLTLRHYSYVSLSSRVHTAAWNSLRLAIGGATLCILLAALISYVTVKTKILGRGVLEGLAFIPWAFPGASLAIGLLWAYVDFPLPVYNTLWILLIAYITRWLPYGLRATSSTIIQIHDELEEASRACGAGFMATFRRILLPLIRPGIVAGWILLATGFIREFGTSIFLYSPGAEPLGPLLFFLYQDGLYGAVCALGILVCCVSLGLTALARRYLVWNTETG